MRLHVAERDSLEADESLRLQLAPLLRQLLTELVFQEGADAWLDVIRLCFAHHALPVREPDVDEHVRIAAARATACNVTAHVRRGPTSVAT